MHAITLFSKAIPDASVPPLPEEPADGLCCVTGLEGPTIARKHLLTSSFTQWDQLMCIHSDRVGVDVWRAWMYGERREGKNRDFRPERMSSWIVSPSGLTLLDRQGVRDLVLEPPQIEPWAGYATTSYKKHGSLLAPVNTAGRAVWLWELTQVDCSHYEQVQAWWQQLRQFQDAGIPRPVLETADPEPHLIAKIGVTLALEFAEWARPRRDSSLYQFLCYLLPSVEELKATKPQPAKETPDVCRNLELF